MGWLAAFFDISLQAANRLYAWGWGLSVSGAAVTMLGVGMLWLGTRVRDHDFDEQIATLHSSASASEERAADTRKQTATLETAAAQARLEQERLKQTVAWRSLQPEIAGRLMEVLATKPQNVIIAYTAYDPESLFYAGHFMEAFKWAGWHSTAEGRAYARWIIFGIHIPGPESEGVILLRKAFDAAGISYGTDDPPTPEMVFGGASHAPGVPILIIGSKTLPPTGK
jgi:hypothetical protein